MKTARTKIKNDTLESYLKSDLKMLGIPVDFTLEFRGYSSSYYGRYHIKEKKVVVFILDIQGNQLPYHELLDTVMHEALHHYQHYYQEGFVRHTGVMHDMEFHRMYNEYLTILKSLEVIPYEYTA